MIRAIVTGASSGIGLETSRLLGKENIEVVLVARSVEALNAMAGEICTCGGRGIAMPTDLAIHEDCRQMIASAKELPGDAYPVLVNAAGVAEFGDFATMSVEAIERQIRVNLLGPLHACHAILPWMLEHGGGQIINVLSITASQVFTESAAYSTSKAGLYMLGKVLSAEYRRKGVRVTSILPGAVDTPLWEGQAFIPPRDQMLPATAVAEAIRDLVLMPHDRNVDEIHLMPPFGTL